MKVLLDADGVLFDFATPALRLVTELGGPVVSADECTEPWLEKLLPEGPAREEWWKRVTGEGFCAQLELYPGAKEAVLAMREVAEVVVVTAPMSQTGKTWAFERMNALREQLGFHRDDVISLSGKHHVPGDVFADDQPAHVDRWRKTHRDSYGILIARPYNARPSGYALPRMPLDSVVDLVAQLAQKSAGGGR